MSIFYCILVLSLSMTLFIIGRWRHDVIAVFAMVAVVALKIIPTDEALKNFGHPAVVTVACVLVISRILRQAGFSEKLAQKLTHFARSRTLIITVMTTIVAALSAFMNNVGALAVMLPVAMSVSKEHSIKPAILLMPLAFGSILGGLVTMFGTPPNIIIATYRKELLGEPFGMLDFSPVGLAVAGFGILFVGLIGWRLIPKDRAGSSAELLYSIKDYICEVRVTETSPLIGQQIGLIELFKNDDIMPIGLVRNSEKVARPSRWRRLQANDLLILKADPAANNQAFVDAGLTLVAEAPELDQIQADNVQVIEAIITRDSPILGRDVAYLVQRSVGMINLLALAREGRAIASRLQQARFQVGDVLLLQGDKQAIDESLNTLKLFPLAERDFTIGQTKGLLSILGIFLGALLIATTGYLSISMAFLAAILVYVIIGVLPVRDVYRDIDWSIIIFLGAMMSLGQALEYSGAAKLIAEWVVASTTTLSPVAILFLILIVTMTLSDVINNAATALIMAPIAAKVASLLSVSPDPFLMAVAIGASCAFLTPIGHQSNTLVMGPGGYHFGDYWRMGLPLQIVLVIVAMPCLLYFWPL